MLAFLTWMPCANSTAQSRNADSLAVVRQFVGNAKPLLDSLTALHFARLELRMLNEQNQRHRQQRDQMAQGYVLAQQQIGQGSQDQLALKQDLALERQKRRRAQWENWAWRLGAAYLAYRKLCPSCRF